MLHPADSPGATAQGEDLFRPSCLERLKAICRRGGAQIVLSSSWRLESQGVREVQGQLATVGLELLGTTRCDTTLGPRFKSSGEGRKELGKAPKPWPRAF